MKNLTIISSICVFAFAFNSCKKAESEFSISKSTVWVGEPFSIKDGIKDGTKNLSYYYDFGDETYSVPNEFSQGVKNPSHVYQKAGVYTISQQITQSRNNKRRYGKSYSSSVDINVITVAPSLSLSVNNLSLYQPLLIYNTTNEEGNLGYPVNYNISIIGPNGTSSYNNVAVVNWAPSQVGNYEIKLTATQGNSVSKVSKTITVTGPNTNTSLYLFTGTWSVSVNGQVSGNVYTGSCVAPEYNTAYSTVFMNNGNIYAGISANTGSTSIGAGNYVNIGVYFSFLDANLVSVNSANVLFNIKNSGYPSFGPNGIYKVLSATNNSITLSRILNGSTNVGCGQGTINENYEITFTR